MVFFQLFVLLGPRWTRQYLIILIAVICTPSADSNLFQKYSHRGSQNITNSLGIPRILQVDRYNYPLQGIFLEDLESWGKVFELICIQYRGSEALS
jgi:hypothetical protein